MNNMNNMNPNAYYQKMVSPNVPKQQQMTYDSNFPNYWDETSKKKYGLAKIDDIFKNKNPDFSIFTFGIDLTKFGLNLNSDTEIFSTFGSPFAENPTREDRQNFKIPSCYLEPNLQINKDFFKKFKDETLFYIFYNMKEEALQMMAVEELYSKGWTYNFKIETWFRDLEQLRANIFNGKCFNIKGLNVVNVNNFEMNEGDLCKLEQFKESLQY